MDTLVFNIESLLPKVFLGLVSWGLISWAFQCACDICSVDRPGFWKAALAVAIGAGANAVLLGYYDAASVERTVFTWLVVPAGLAVLIIAFTVRTGPFSASVVLLTHVVLMAAGLGVVQLARATLLSGVV
ncbi:MAG: hypothetical protein AAGA92_02685 [Planctomycetota bacterium]